MKLKFICFTEYGRVTEIINFPDTIRRIEIDNAYALWLQASAWYGWEKVEEIVGEEFKEGVNDD